MAEISKITLPSGTTYDIKDSTARSAIASLNNWSYIVCSAAANTPKDVTWTSGGTTITGTLVATADTMYKIYLVPSTNGTNDIYDEYITVNPSGTSYKWEMVGNTDVHLSDLGALAYKNNASGSYTPAGTVSTPTFTGSSSTVTVTATNNSSGNYTPAGTVSKPTFTGSSTTFTGTYTPAGTVTVTAGSTTNKNATVSATTGTATYTPAGSVAAPTISVSSAGTTTNINSVTNAGTLPVLTTTVANETLTISFSQGTLPILDTDIAVKTGDAAYTASAPAFTGTGVRLITANIAVPTTPTASFTGNEATLSVSGIPNGAVSQPTFTGTKVQITGTVTAAGTVSQPTFTGNSATITVS